MRRRQFLAGLGILPLASCAMLKPFLRKEQLVDKSEKTHEQSVVLDYASNRQDKHGYVFRRMVEHPDVVPILVREASVCTNGDLFVTCYALSNFRNEEIAASAEDLGDLADLAVYDRFVNRAIKTARYLDTERRSVLLMDARLPKGEWVVNQYDGLGRKTKRITAADFVA